MSVPSPSAPRKGKPPGPRAPSRATAPPSLRRILWILALDLRILAASRAHALNLVWAALCIAAVASVTAMGEPGAPREAAPRRPVLTITGDAAWPELRIVAAAHGFDVTAPSAPGLALAVTPGEGKVLRLRSHGVEAATPNQILALRQVIAEATGAYRDRLVSEAGLPEEIGTPVDDSTDTAMDPVDVSATEAPALQTFLPDLSAQFALAVGLVGVLYAVIETFVQARSAGRLEILLSTRATPVEYALSRVALGTLVAAAVAAASATLMPAAAWLLGEAYRPANLGLLAAGPLVAAALTPLALLAAARFERVYASTLAANMAVAPFVGASALVALGGFLGFDPAWVAAVPLHGVSRWLQGRDVPTDLALASAGLTAALAVLATWLACRTARARMFLQADL